MLMVMILWIIIQKTVCEKYIPHELYLDTNVNTLDKNILSYNIQKFPWNIKSFNDSDFYKIIKQHSIILLQECFDETFGSLENCFPEYYICRGKLKGLNPLNSGLVILSRFPLYDVEFYQYKNYDILSFDLFSEKGFLSVLTKINNEYIRIINTHLQSSSFKRYDEKALLQLQELEKYLKKLDKINVKYIVGGDFNIDIKDIDNLYDIGNRKLYYPNDSTIFIDFVTSHSTNQKKDGYEPLIFDYFLTKNINMDKPTVVKCDYSDHNPITTTFRV